MLAHFGTLIIRERAAQFGGATAKEIADKIRPRFQQQGWIK
ncbi:MAG: hypothetical protein ACREIS_15180 [Nitrospiraceae bacterium]